MTPEDDSIITKLNERAQQSQRLQERIEQHLAAVVPETPRQRWGQWITASCTEMHDSIWNMFMQESFTLVTRYTSQSKILHQQDRQQRYQLPQTSVQPQGVLQPPQTCAVPQQQIFHTAANGHVSPDYTDTGQLAYFWPCCYDVDPE